MKEVLVGKPKCSKYRFKFWVLAIITAQITFYDLASDAYYIYRVPAYNSIMWYSLRGALALPFLAIIMFAM